VIQSLFDRAVAAVALLLLSPLLLVLAVLVRTTSRGPVIFRQQRVGRDGRLFEIYKFRTMTHNGTTGSGEVSPAGDPRVTPVGRVLRGWYLDELPQLVNVVKGDMSLVGPRPERPHFVEQFSAQYELYTHRHRVKAGLTGLAQVSGLRGDTSIADRARYDNFYIENWSLWLDVKIILRTVSEVLFAKGR
jgi:exopolysaccharide biosynthesis polyprenyl glycosylphosphotransferase